MPKLPVTAEPTDWKENGITFAYTAETATHSFANYVQEWNEYDIYVKVLWPRQLDYSTLKLNRRKNTIAPRKLAWLRPEI